LTVNAGGIRFIAGSLANVGQISDQPFELPCISAFPIRCCEMPDYPCINVNGDVKFEIIFFLGFALYSDIKPLTARFKAES